MHAEKNILLCIKLPDFVPNLALITMYGFSINMSLHWTWSIQINEDWKHCTAVQLVLYHTLKWLLPRGWNAFLNDFNMTKVEPLVKTLIVRLIYRTLAGHFAKHGKLIYMVWSGNFGSYLVRTIGVNTADVLLHQSTPLQMRAGILLELSDTVIGSSKHISDSKSMIQGQYPHYSDTVNAMLYL